MPSSAHLKTFGSHTVPVPLVGRWEDSGGQRVRGVPGGSGSRWRIALRHAVGDSAYTLLVTRPPSKLFVTLDCEWARDESGCVTCRISQGASAPAQARFSRGTRGAPFDIFIHHQEDGQNMRIIGVLLTIGVLSGAMAIRAQVEQPALQGLPQYGVTLTGTLENPIIGNHSGRVVIGYA
jgi:hypothetical protein